MTWITSAIHTTSKGCSLCLHQYTWRVHLYQWGCTSLLLFASPPRAFSFKSPSWWRGLPQRSISHPKDVLFACTITPEEFISTSGAASLFSSLHLLPRAFSFKSPSWWRGLPQRSIPHPKDVLFACTNASEEFISTSGAASLFSSLHLLRVHSLTLKSSFLPVGLHLSSVSSLHFLRVYSLLNPHPDDVDYLSDPYHVQRMFLFACTNAPEEFISIGVGAITKDKALGWQAIVHKQCLPPPPPPMLCICRTDRRLCLSLPEGLRLSSPLCISSACVLF